MARKLYFTVSIIFSLISFCSGFTAEIDSLTMQSTRVQEAPPAATPEEMLQQTPQNEAELNDRFYSEFFKMLWMLGLIIGFLLIVSWFLKKMMNTRLQQMNSSSLVQIVERRPLTPKTTVYVLEILGRKVVIAESHNGIVALTEFGRHPGFEKMLNEDKT